MVTPLHIEIAMHYHCRTVQHPMLRNEVHRHYAEDLVRAGLLCEEFGEDGFVAGFLPTPGLRIWIEAICSVPFPVQQWVIPSPALPIEEKTL